MSNGPILRLGSFKDPLRFQAHLRSLQRLRSPATPNSCKQPTPPSCFLCIVAKSKSATASHFINPMEGWDWNSGRQPKRLHVPSLAKIWIERR